METEWGAVNYPSDLKSLKLSGFLLNLCVNLR